MWKYRVPLQTCNLGAMSTYGMYVCRSSVKITLFIVLSWIGMMVQCSMTFPLELFLADDTRNKLSRQQLTSSLTYFQNSRETTPSTAFLTMCGDYQVRWPPLKSQEQNAYNRPMSCSVVRDPHEPWIWCFHFASKVQFLLVKTTFGARYRRWLRRKFVLEYKSNVNPLWLLFPNYQEES